MDYVDLKYRGERWGAPATYFTDTYVPLGITYDVEMVLDRLPNDSDGIVDGINTYFMLVEINSYGIH